MIIKRFLKFGLYSFFIGVIFIYFLDYFIENQTKKQLFYKIDSIPKSYTGLILGSKVYANGNPSGILKDRLDAGIELYQNHKIKRFLLSGDHGTTKYDEVNTMKKYLHNEGIPLSNIFLDHAGFDTYNSIIRAKKIFKVTDLTIITQKFHLKRSLFIANQLGINANGFIADKHQYAIANKMNIREKLANVKALLELLINRNPKFLGKAIPITGESSKSFD